MITNEVYMEIEVLRKHGFSLRRIAAEVGCAVNTVRSHLATGEKPKYERQKKRPSKLSPYEGYLRERQASAQPHWIPATVLYREIAAQGYLGGMSQLRSFLRGIKPALRPDPVVRFETAPVYGKGGEVVAALNISGQANRTDPAQMLREMLPPLREAAQTITQLLRASGAR